MPFTGWEYGVEEQRLPLQSVPLACALFLAENNQGPKDSGRPMAFPQAA